jgi:hypothetical protein
MVAVPVEDTEVEAVVCNVKVGVVVLLVVNVLERDDEGEDVPVIVSVKLWD